MTTTSLALRERLTAEQITYVAKTELIPKAYRGNVPALLACIATGRELGIPDRASTRLGHVVDGKATLASECMNMLARQHGHSIKVVARTPGESVTVRGRRRDNGDEQDVTWTLEMSKAAGLAVKPNWKNYPDAMLFARAVSQLCRELFPDVFMGLAYTPDEFGETSVEVPSPESFDVVDDDAVEVLESEIDEALAAPEDPAGDAAAPAEGSLFQPPTPEVEASRKRNRRETAE